jgi:hypothetical protein
LIVMSVGTSAVDASALQPNDAVPPVGTTPLYEAFTAHDS